MAWERLSIWGTYWTVSFWTCDSIDLVSRREFSKDASMESVDDERVSISTSVARDLVHDLVGNFAIFRPTKKSAMRPSLDSFPQTMPYERSS